MRPYSRFARDLHDIHGRVVLTSPADIDPAAAIGLGFFALVAFLATVAFALGFGLVLVIFGFSAFVPHPATNLDPNLIPVATAVIR